MVKAVEEIMEQEFTQSFSPEAIIDLLTSKLPMSREEAEKKAFEVLGTVAEQTANAKVKLEETGKVMFETGLSLFEEMRKKMKK